MLKLPIITAQSSFEWRGDGRAILTLRKSNAPSFWRYLMNDPVKEAKELQTWWEMRDRHIEQLEDYILEEKAKDELWWLSLDILFKIII